MDLSDLYQEMNHRSQPQPAKLPRDRRSDPACRGLQPTVRDRLKLYLRVRDGVIDDIAFEGAGCAISVASASLMTEQIKGKTEQEATGLFKQFHQLVTSDGDALPDPALGKLAALAGVRAYPARVKCATLAWHTLDSALAGNDSTTTE